MALYLKNELELNRCPHCNVDKPRLFAIWADHTVNHSGINKRFWKLFQCSSCGGLVTAASGTSNEGYITEIYPSAKKIDDTIPSPADAYLQQALDSLHAPAGAVMLSASAVDAMLKAKGYTQGSLYTRIEQAAEDNLITDDMKQWAHDVRLDANDQRHADQAATLPNGADAQRCLDFALALAQFLFVLPARVKRGLAAVTINPSPNAPNTP